MQLIFSLFRIPDRRLFDGVVYYILLSIKSTKLILKNCATDLFTFFLSKHYTLLPLPLYYGLQRKKNNRGVDSVVRAAVGCWTDGKRLNTFTTRACTRRYRIIGLLLIRLWLWLVGNCKIYLFQLITQYVKLQVVPELGCLIKNWHGSHLWLIISCENKNHFLARNALTQSLCSVWFI